MAMIAFDCAGLPASRIIGTGTLLDSSRLRTLLAGELDVAPGSVDALVLGEHGDSEVGLMSTIRVGGLLLADFSDAGGELDQRELAQTVRDAGYAIVSGKRSEEHTSELQSLMRISYAVFCLKKKN